MNEFKLIEGSRLQITLDLGELPAWQIEEVIEKFFPEDLVDRDDKISKNVPLEMRRAIIKHMTLGRRRDPAGYNAIEMFLGCNFFRVSDVDYFTEVLMKKVEEADDHDRYRFASFIKEFSDKAVEIDLRSSPLMFQKYVRFFQLLYKDFMRFNYKSHVKERNLFQEIKDNLAKLPIEGNLKTSIESGFFDK